VRRRGTDPVFILEHYFASKPSVSVRVALISASRDKEALIKSRLTASEAVKASELIKTLKSRISLYILLHLRLHFKVNSLYKRLSILGYDAV
jgi:hypothetical protein